MRKAMFQKLAAQRSGIQTQAVSTIDAPSVIPGDVVFFEAVDPDQPPGSELPPGAGRVHHVEICTNPMEIIGQVDISPDPERGREELRQTRKASLRPNPKHRLIVMRCRTQSLSAAAARYAIAWFDQTIPFQRRRVAPSADEPVRWHRDKFNETGKFRAIRYAARRAGDIHQVDDNRLVTKAMNCSHFVAACFQVAGLENVVAAAPAGVKVQDKKARYSVDEIPIHYRTVLNKFALYQAADDANPVSNDSRPGIIYWNFDANGDIDVFDWDTHITKGMRVDSKYVMPKDLLKCLLDDQTAWTMAGVVKFPD